MYMRIPRCAVHCPSLAIIWPGLTNLLLFARCLTIRENASKKIFPGIDSHKEKIRKRVVHIVPGTYITKEVRQEREVPKSIRRLFLSLYCCCSRHAHANIIKTVNSFIIYIIYLLALKFTQITILAIAVECE